MDLDDFQYDIRTWIKACFGEEIANDKVERNHRFIEEALELVQACGMTKDEVLLLVDYVYNRPPGELKQEVGGVITTINSLCSAHHIKMSDCAAKVLPELWAKIDKIRQKRLSKPRNSILPQ
jgi:NTP pyrophosphatase (non-canonical NTP hydrolase)